MSSNLPVHHRPAGILAAIKGSSIGSEVAGIQEDAFLARVRRSAERDLALLEIGDVEALGMRGLDAAGQLAGRAGAEVVANQLAASGVGRVLETSNAGLQQILRRYIDHG